MNGKGDQSLKQTLKNQNNIKELLINSIVENISKLDNKYFE